MQDELPRGWKLIFGIEIPICLATCVYWFGFPSDYFAKLLGRQTFDAADYVLLQQRAIPIFSVYVYFYGRLLLSPKVPLRLFLLTV